MEKIEICNFRIVAKKEDNDEGFQITYGTHGKLNDEIFEILSEEGSKENLAKIIYVIEQITNSLTIALGRKDSEVMKSIKNIVDEYMHIKYDAVRKGE